MDSETERYQNNLRDELDGSALYAGLARAETDPVRKDLFLQLSQAEAEHAALWRAKLEAAGVAPARFTPSLRTRVLIKLARHFGPRFVLPAQAATEFSDLSKYAGQPDAATLSGDERSHAAVLKAVAGRSGGMTGAQIAKAERWHRRGSGNELRAAVLGANDGLVSNLCLVTGIAGAGSPGRTILLTGLAGLIAGALSMALGEWLSVTNAREFARTQIAQELDEIETTPAAECKELALIFQAKGLSRDEAQRVARELMRDKTAALDTLAREELGIDPGELGGNPWSAAGFSFLLFAVGALVPVLPFFFASGAAGIAWSAGLSALALGAIGLATSLFSGRGPLYSVLRQILIGAAAAGVTYGTGAAIGVSLS
ncbi:VIT1/CCC1 transporter family protein [Massilia horti]|uniref:Rubrerythrin family protein n=1 Tax=Massilia horti TaxID=2562153 RepID=A0A4Y9SNH9_9BURK|nr:VIT1/CCC1 transporter family protein [Massilia horti]TFW28240.1 rubrerythrin family protein [Massilia horti]